MICLMYQSGNITFNTRFKAVTRENTDRFTVPGYGLKQHYSLGKGLNLSDICFYVNVAHASFEFLGCLLFILCTN